MKFIIATAALLVATVANAQTVFTDCAPPGADLTINAFTLSPDPLCIGKDVCATGTGLLNTEVVDGASLAITGKYLGRVVYTDNHDLCELMGDQGHPCPIPTTLTSITACVLVKTTAPASIPVSLTVLAMNGNGNTLFCQSATVTATNNALNPTACPP
ncbi:hypothetical protein BG011_004622 [Mortierella polycephala]|uniref:Phosphatidylglycerol/phosphatidylinositol transfer protein n=1 Tax=Mortierella polycephala TaxID=41804 RepID=A0A9P6U1D8_9FUNG|nr:hypothetical protein BG011_004622 [Mortierella polycephala]